MAKPLSEAEQDILVKFRQKLSDLDLSQDLFQDRHLIRWLRARDLDIPKAEAMLRKSLEWREQNDIDTILNNPIPKCLTDEYQFEISGFDKDGGAVVVVEYGKWDLRKFINDKGMKLEVIHMIFYYFEQVYKILEEKSMNGKTFKQFTVIGDMEGLSFKQFTSVEIVETIVTCVRAFEANYPESLNCAFITNAPSIFSILYGLAKPFLSESTARKIQIFGPNSKKFMPAVLQQIEPDQFPEKYGGSQPYRGVYSFASNGNNCNENDSLSACKDNFGDLAKVTVNAGATLNLPYEIEVPNTTFSFTFETVDYDIGFSLYLDNNGSKRQVCRYERVNSHLGQQTRSVICDIPGKYVLSFDNTYSRMRSKLLRYRVSISLPENSEEDEKFTDL